MRCKKPTLNVFCCFVLRSFLMHINRRFFLIQHISFQFSLKWDWALVFTTLYVPSPYNIHVQHKELQGKKWQAYRVNTHNMFIITRGS